jgi:hypothetical protein
MKPSRKLNHGSFMSRVSGGGGPKPAGGQGKSAVENDHDLGHPSPPGGGGPGGDPDSGPH